MKKGLTQPPVNAPVLPENYWYEIGYYIGDMGPNYWQVIILEDVQGKGWFRSKTIYSRRAGRGTENTTGNPIELSHESMIHKACERAYNDMLQNDVLHQARKKYQGAWSGQ